MCRLFGMSGGSEPVRATFWLLQASDSLSEQGRREPDGTGIGFFDAAGSPVVSKQPLAAYADRRFAEEAKHVVSRTFVAHVRFASTGALTVDNTHPFEQDGRLFAHNGVIEGLPALESELGAEGMALVHGETDSERWFALITRAIARADGDVAAGIESATRWVAANLPLLSANFVLIEADQLWALRYPDGHELHVLEREAGGGGASGPASLRHRSSNGQIHVASDELAQRPAVVVATEPMDDDPGWRELGSGQLLHVDQRLHVSVTTVVDRPPTHPLTVADLTGRAAGSQADPPATHCNGRLTRRRSSRPPAASA
jgi:predicted glutamine amidotransferase